MIRVGPMNAFHMNYTASATECAPSSASTSICAGESLKNIDLMPTEMLAGEEVYLMAEAV